MDMTTEERQSLPDDHFLHAARFLCLGDMARAQAVSRSWWALLQADHLWAPLCDQAWQGKAYVPQALRLMGGGEAVFAAAEAAERTRLSSLKIRELKVQLSQYRVSSAGLPTLWGFKACGFTLRRICGWT